MDDVETKCGMRPVDNRNYMCHICANGFLDLSFI